MNSSEIGPGPTAPLTRRTKFFYGLGDWGTSASSTARNLFWFYFLISVVGINPALAGTVALVSKLWDGINDPLVGMLSDRLNTRWGRRRPLLLFSAVPFGFGFFLLFSVPPIESDVLLAVYYGVMFMLFDTLYTVLNVPYTALAAELTQDYDERSNLAGWRTSVAIAASLASAGLFKVLSENVFGARFGGGLDGIIQGYGLTAAIWGVTFVIPPVLLFFAVKEPERPIDRTPLRFWATMGEAFRNRPFRILAITYLLTFTTMEMVVAVLIWFLIYAVEVPSGFDSVAIAVLLGLALLSMPLIIRLMHRVGKRNTYLICIAFWGAADFLISLVPPGGYLWVLVLALVAGPALGAAQAIPWALLSDVIEEDEWQTGKRREGTYAGFMVFMRKLASAGALFLVGNFLAMNGFVEANGGSVVVEQPESAITALRILVGVIPPGILAVAGVIMWRYPLNRAAHEELRLRLASRGEQELV